jgi:hypothetical protein
MHMEPEEAVDPKTVLHCLVAVLTDAESVLERLQEIKKNTGGGSRELSLAITEQETVNWRLGQACNLEARKEQAATL